MYVELSAVVPPAMHELGTTAVEAKAHTCAREETINLFQLALVNQMGIMHVTVAIELPARKISPCLQFYDPPVLLLIRPTISHRLPFVRTQ